MCLLSHFLPCFRKVFLELPLFLRMKAVPLPESGLCFIHAFFMIPVRSCHSKKETLKIKLEGVARLIGHLVPPLDFSNPLFIPEFCGDPKRKTFTALAAKKLVGWASESKLRAWEGWQSVSSSRSPSTLQSRSIKEEENQTYKRTIEAVI